jgi:hypothetical protein
VAIDHLKSKAFMSKVAVAALLSCLFGFKTYEAKAASKKEKDAGGWTEKTKEDGKVVQELKIEAPSMTEEDQYGYKMPDRYKCDSCRAVMFHLNQALTKAHPSSRRMKQWEFTELFDEACKNSFEGYGIKLLNGENTLSGPGLVHAESQLTPGSGAIQMGGETWGKRLTEHCREIVYDKVGEDELYEKYREDGGLTESICFQDIRYCTTGPKTPPAPKAEKDVPKKEKKKDAKDKKKEAKEKKEKPETSTPKKTEPIAAATTTMQSSVAEKKPEERIDALTFLRSLALRHGLTSDEYVAARTEREWEKLTMAMAGRIFNHLADNQPSETCAAK